MAKHDAIVEIYGLTCPYTGIVRYIGKANDHLKRFKSHLRDSHRRDTPVYRWIRKLASEGKVPGIALLYHTWEWRETERMLIAQYKSFGQKLLNVAEGGDEPYCSQITRAENGRKVAKIRISTPLKERLYKLKKALGDSLRAGYVSDETKAKLRKAAIDKPWLFGEYANI